MNANNSILNISTTVNTARLSIDQIKAVEPAVKHLNINVKYSLEIKTEVGDYKKRWYFP